MSYDFSWMSEIHPWQLALLMVTLFVGYYWLGAIFIRPILWVLIGRSPGINDIIGYVLSCFCVFYGLLLGLIAVTAYQNFAAADQNVTQEAAALSALYEDVSRYPEPFGQDLRWLLRDYTRYAIKYAWPLQRKGIVPQEGTIRAEAVFDRLLDFQPKTSGEQILHAEALRQLNHFLECRRMRLFAVTTGLPASMWYVMFIGAAFNILLCWMFQTKFMTQLVLGGILAAYLGMTMYLIIDMNQPFRGEVSIPSDVFESLYLRMDDA